MQYANIRIIKNVAKNKRMSYLCLFSLRLQSKIVSGVLVSRWLSYFFKVSFFFREILGFWPSDDKVGKIDMFLKRAKKKE